MEAGCVYTIFAGVNGAGKSTLYLSMEEELSNQERVNSDEILKNFGGNWKNQEDQAKAMKEAIRKIKFCLDNKISFNQETTLTGNSILKNISIARKQGYRIHMYYVGVDNVDIAIKRVALRERKGGHGISEADIRRRYINSMENLYKAIPMCDTVRIFDNTYKFKSVAFFQNGHLLEHTAKCRWFQENILFRENVPER